MYEIYKQAWQNIWSFIAFTSFNCWRDVSFIIMWWYESFLMWLDNRRGWFEIVSKESNKNCHGRKGKNVTCGKYFLSNHNWLDVNSKGLIYDPTKDYKKKTFFCSQLRVSTKLIQKGQPKKTKSPRLKDVSLYTRQNCLLFLWSKLATTHQTAY